MIQLNIILLLIYIILGITDIVIWKKTDKRLNDIEEKVSENKNVTKNIEYDLETSMKLKKYIDDLIEDEIIYVLKNYIVTYKKYDMLKLDNDAKKISESVYNSFKKDYLINNNLVFVSDFYQSYIIKRSISRFLIVVKDYNNEMVGIDIQN